MGKRVTQITFKKKANQGLFFCGKGVLHFSVFYLENHFNPNISSIWKRNCFSILTTNIFEICLAVKLLVQNITGQNGVYSLFYICSLKCIYTHRVQVQCRCQSQYQKMYTLEERGGKEKKRHCGAARRRWRGGNPLAARGLLQTKRRWLQLTPDDLAIVNLSEKKWLYSIDKYRPALCSRVRCFAIKETTITRKSKKKKV